MSFNDTKFVYIVSRVSYSIISILEKIVSIDFLILLADSEK